MPCLHFCYRKLYIASFFALLISRHSHYSVPQTFNAKNSEKNFVTVVGIALEHGLKNLQQPIIKATATLTNVEAGFTVGSHEILKRSNRDFFLLF